MRPRGIRDNIVVCVQYPTGPSASLVMGHRIAIFSVIHELSNRAYVYDILRSGSRILTLAFLYFLSLHVVNNSKNMNKSSLKKVFFYRLLLSSTTIKILKQRFCFNFQEEHKQIMKREEKLQQMRDELKQKAIVKRKVPPKPSPI